MMSLQTFFFLPHTLTPTVFH